MREIINVAHAQGMYNGKPINATSNPLKIIVQNKCYCACECIRETFCVSGLCVNECYVYYNGLQQFKLNGRTFIRVGYGICIKYIDCDSNQKSITKQGSALFFEPPKEYSNNYRVYIPNPPFLKVCENTIISEFDVILYD